MTPRTLLEARLWLEAQGREGATLTRVGDRALGQVAGESVDLPLSQPEDPSFPLGRGRSEVLTPDDLRALRARVMEGLPEDPRGLPAEVLEEVRSELVLTIALLDQEQLGGWTPEGEAERSSLRDRLARLSPGEPSRPAREVPLPALGARLLPSGRAAVVQACADPAVVQRLLSGTLGTWWVFAELGDPVPRLFLRHAAGAVVEVLLRPDRLARSARLLEGERAVDAWVGLGFRLGAEERAELRRRLTPGLAAEAALAALPSGAILRGEVASASETWRFVELRWVEGAAVRGGLVLLLLSPDGRLRGHRVLDGAVAWHQLGLLREAGAAAAGASGSPPAELLETLTRIEQDLSPLVMALGRDEAAARAAVRARPEDLQAVFTPAWAARLAGQAFELPPAPKRPPTGLRLVACPAAALDRPFDRAEAFDLPFRRLGPVLRPERVWLVGAWSTSDGAHRFEGLVWTGERLVWFPGLPLLVLRLAAPPPRGPVVAR